MTAPTVPSGASPESHSSACADVTPIAESVDLRVSLAHQCNGRRVVDEDFLASAPAPVGDPGDQRDGECEHARRQRQCQTDPHAPIDGDPDVERNAPNARNCAQRDSDSRGNRNKKVPVGADEAHRQKDAKDQGATDHQGPDAPLGRKSDTLEGHRRCVPARPVMSPWQRAADNDERAEHTDNHGHPPVRAATPARNSKLMVDLHGRHVSTRHWGNSPIDGVDGGALAVVGIAVEVPYDRGRFRRSKPTREPAVTLCLSEIGWSRWFYVLERQPVELARSHCRSWRGTGKRPEPDGPR